MYNAPFSSVLLTPSQIINDYLLGRAQRVPITLKHFQILARLRRAPVSQHDWPDIVNLLTY